MRQKEIAKSYIAETEHRHMKKSYLRLSNIYGGSLTKLNLDRRLY